MRDRARPKPYSDPVALDIAPNDPAKATPAMHSAVGAAMHEVGTSLMQHGDKVATLGTIGFAFRHVADKLRTPSPERGPSGPSTGGLLGTPAPDQEATS